MLPNEVEKLDIDVILISAFKSRIEIRKEISQLSAKYQVIDVYDILQAKGISVDKEFYHNVGASYHEVRSVLGQLDTGKGKDRNKIIKKLIGEYLHIRDFTDAFHYIQVLEENNASEFLSYKELRHKIEEEFDRLKDRIDGTEHIVINWIDALRADEVTNMPFVNKLRNQGINFENAHTVAPYTSATLKTIFKGELYLDGKLFEIENIGELEDSKLYKLITGEGYSFRYIGAKEPLGIFFNAKTCAWFQLGTRGYEIASTIWQWELLIELDNCNDRSIILVHNMAETHAPNINGIQKNYKHVDEKDIYKLYKGDDKVGLSELQKQICQSQQYLDIQLKFYYKIYENIRYHIFMSDHGQYRGEQPVCFQGHTHILFFILGHGIYPKNEKRIFSIVKFPQIIECLLKNNQKKIIDCTDEYAMIQSDDCYCDKVFERFYVNPNAYKEFYVQHRGVIGLEDSYLGMISGEEYYFKKGIKGNLIDSADAQERIREMKELAGNKYIDIFKHDKYAFSRKMYQMLNVQVSKDIEFL